jgi:hypothetical protein
MNDCGLRGYPPSGGWADTTDRGLRTADTNRRGASPTDRTFRAGVSPQSVVRSRLQSAVRSRLYAALRC